MKKPPYYAFLPMLNRVLALLPFLLGTLEALPAGMEVLSGDVSVEQSSSTVSLQTGEKTVLSWETFSVGSGEVVHFAQKDPSSCVVNRVSGSASSQILGKVASNGRLFLLNPHGIFIGPEGRIEAASFFASTLDFPDLENPFLFQGDSLASIEHQGSIDCPEGKVLLAARNIVTSGRVRASSVILVAGRTALFQPEGLQRQFFKLTEEFSDASSLYRSSISQSHPSNAMSLHEGEGGEIVLLASRENGLFASGEVILSAPRIVLGGTITTEGGEVTLAGKTLLQDNVKIDTTHGGLAPAGASVTFLESSSTINGAGALSIHAGTQGEVIFGGMVGNNTPLTSIEVTASSISLYGVHAVSSGPMSYQGDIALHAAQSFVQTGSSGGMHFVGNIVGNYPLTFQARSSTICVEGNIDTSGQSKRGARVTANSLGDIHFLGLIDTRGGEALAGRGKAGGCVSLTSREGSITLSQINTSGGCGATQGGNAGSIALRPCANSCSNGKILFTESKGKVAHLIAEGGSGMHPGLGGMIFLGVSGRGKEQKVTTSSFTADAFISCGTFKMESEDTLTSSGSITIHAKTAAILGDLVAPEKIRVFSPEVFKRNLLDATSDSSSSTAGAPSSVLQQRNQGVNDLLVAEAELTDRLSVLYRTFDALKWKILPKNGKRMSE